MSLVGDKTDYLTLITENEYWQYIDELMIYGDYPEELFTFSKLICLDIKKYGIEHTKQLEYVCFHIACKFMCDDYLAIKNIVASDNYNVRIYSLEREVFDLCIKYNILCKYYFQILDSIKT